jgi:hypothetical protein
LHDEGAGVETAHRRQAQKAAVVYVSHEKANRVHVSAQHDLRPAPVAPADDVAEAVDLDGIDEVLELLLDHLSYAFFAARDTRRRDQRLEQWHIHGLLNLLSA